MTKAGKRLLGAAREAFARQCHEAEVERLLTKAAFDYAKAEIERLRDWGSNEARNAFEAAAEIERLRAVNIWLKDRLRDAVNVCYGGTTHDEIDRHTTEPKP